VPYVHACTISLILWLSFNSAASAQGPRNALLTSNRAAAQTSSDSGFATALDHYLDENGVLLWPGAPVLIGKAQLRAFSPTPRASAAERLTWQPLGIEFSRDSTLGVLWGIALTTQPADSSPPRVGRFISAWQRDRDQWRIAAFLLMGPVAREDSGPAGLPLRRQEARRTARTSAFIDADLAFARLAKDSGAATAFRRWAATDALTFGGAGLLIRGPAAISQAVAGPERWRWHPVMAGGSSGHDLGWTVGEASIAGAQGVSYSKYLTIWTRDSGKLPRYLIDGGNPRPADP
jgi:hypothetical protein